jgi:hypothetical protein
LPASARDVPRGAPFATIRRSHRPFRGPRPGGAMALSDIRAAAADIRRRLDQIKESL